MRDKLTTTRCGADQTEGVGMRRTLLTLVLLALGAIAVALPASAASDRELKAQFRDSECTAHDLCGSGLVEGYGLASTTLDITGAEFDPATGCLINVTAVRDVQLVDDPSSTLRLALTDGLICGVKGSATFTISAATGVFAGLVVLPGTVRVTLIPGPPADTAQYRATIAP